MLLSLYTCKDFGVSLGSLDLTTEDFGVSLGSLDLGVLDFSLAGDTFLGDGFSFDTDFLAEGFLITC